MVSIQSQLVIPVVWAFLSTIPMASTCDYRPVRIPIRDVNLSLDAKRRGAAITIGTPPQAFSAASVSPLNSTWVYPSSAICPGDQQAAAGCIYRRGGQFIPRDSETFVPLENPIPGELRNEMNTRQGLASGFGKDVLRLNDQTNLTDMPLTIGSVKGEVPGKNSAIGLGPGSTILSRLISDGLIASRSWSYWFGLFGADVRSQMDGSLILGGVDKAKFKSPNNFTGLIQDLGDGCTSGMQITIQELTMNFPNGTSANLIDQEAVDPSLVACLSTRGTNLISLPESPYYTQFDRWAGTNYLRRSTGFNTGTMQYSSSSVYQGDLTIGLESGFRVTIPNDQLVVPERFINNSTGTLDPDTGLSNVLMFAYEGGGVPHMGQTFFSAVTLMVNHDSGTFTLLETTPTTEVDIVSIFANQTQADCSPKTEALDVDTSPTSAVAGIVIGSAMYLLLLGLLFRLYRKRSRVLLPEIAIALALEAPPTPVFELPPAAFELAENRQPHELEASLVKL